MDGWLCALMQAAVLLGDRGEEILDTVQVRRGLLRARQSRGFAERSRAHDGPQHHGCGCGAALMAV